MRKQNFLFTVNKSVNWCSLIQGQFGRNYQNYEYPFTHILGAYSREICANKHKDIFTDWFLNLVLNHSKNFKLTQITFQRGIFWQEKFSPFISFFFFLMRIQSHTYAFKNNTQRLLRWLSGKETACLLETRA